MAPRAFVCVLLFVLHGGTLDRSTTLPHLQKVKMPQLVTKTIRITVEQNLELTSNYKEVSSFLFRELFRIYRESQTPGIEIMKLRNSFKK